jgi:cytochrome c biogenesis protein CcmG/thiol:disulfide interchange protein DsbE
MDVKMKKIFKFLPLILVIALGAFLYRGLSLDPQAMPSALVGQAMPDFALTTLSDQSHKVTKADLVGDIVLLNVWATWCPTCKVEHPYLVQLSKNNRFKLYGINYKDELFAARKWLKNYKDPYVFSVFDEQGSLGLDLGVYGAPETFVVDHHGIIRKRFAGAINTRTWKIEFEPVVQQLEAERAQGK